LRAGLTCEHGEVRVTRLVTLDDGPADRSAP
jgi:hypothetical protein